AAAIRRATTSTRAVVYRLLARATQAILPLDDDWCPTFLPLAGGARTPLQSNGPTNGSLEYAMGWDWTPSARIRWYWVLACLVALLRTSVGAGGPAGSRVEDKATIQTMESANATGTGTLPAISRHASCADIVAWLPSQSQPAVVFQVVSEAYVSVQKNFISNMELHSTFSRENMYLICLDEESVDIFGALGIRCVRFGCMGCPVSRHHVWALRIEVSVCLLKAGIDVLMSDADAVWLHDPMDDFDSDDYRDSSIVASRGAMPVPLFRTWGATICMGFVLFRAGSNAIFKFMEVVGEFTEELENDQQAVNLALQELDVVWDPTSDMSFSGSTRSGVGVVHSITSGESLTVSLLPHNKYTRSCRRTPISVETVVAHCISTEKGEGMATWMKEAHLWNVPDDNDSN
ncbi:unnamed protein product, partial [Ectocarpus sp. 13 AM-2016]